MKIVKDINSLNIELSIIATPQYFLANDALDWGYFFHEGYVLPFYTKKRYVFEYMLFTTGVLGNSLLSEKEFLNDVVAYVKDNTGVDFLLCQHVTALFNDVPDGASFCLFGSYVNDIAKPEEAIFSEVHSKHRNVIKKAIKDNVKISFDINNRQKCIDLIQETLIRQGLPILNNEYFEKYLLLEKNVNYWLAEVDDVSHGSAIILWNSTDTAYYMFGGSKERPHTGAMNLLHWEAIKEMQVQNVKKYDFVGARINPEKGSKYEGIQRFKGRFGGELKQGYLWKISIKRWKYFLYNLLIKIKTPTYKGDIIDQEQRRAI